MRAQPIGDGHDAAERVRRATLGLILFEDPADNPEAWRELMPKAPWAQSDGRWTLPRAEVCALALPWSAWDQAAAQMPVGTYTVDRFLIS
eukprot:4428834-Pleurochrysis_carterae.AAC.1